MKNLNFSEFKMRVKNKENTNFIFDIIRKKWFLLTKEEWVRQHCIHFLVYNKQYPISLINIEKKILVNGLTKRYDIVVYSQTAEVIILVECKGYNVNIDKDVFDQISKYNLKLKNKYLIFSNLLSHFFFSINYNLNEYSFIKDLPSHKK